MIGIGNYSSEHTMNGTWNHVWAKKIKMPYEEVRPTMVETLEKKKQAVMNEYKHKNRHHIYDSAV